MKRKLSKKKLKKMIDSDFTDLSKEEIKALIQKEVNKGPDKLDTDYIDLCFELLAVKGMLKAKGLSLKSRLRYY